MRVETEFEELLRLTRAVKDEDERVHGRGWFVRCPEDGVISYLILRRDGVSVIHCCAHQDPEWGEVMGGGELLEKARKPGCRLRVIQKYVGRSAIE